MVETTTIPTNIDELSKKAEEIYGNLPVDLIQSNNGKFIAIETGSGDYFIGDTKEEAIGKSRGKYPQALLFVRRIGNIEKISLHHPLASSNYAYAGLF